MKKTCVICETIHTNNDNFCCDACFFLHYPNKFSGPIDDWGEERLRELNESQTTTTLINPHKP